MPTREPIFLPVDTAVRARLSMLLSVAAWQAILACVFLSLWIGHYPQTPLAGLVLHWAGIVGCVWICSRAILPRAGDSAGELLFSGLIPLIFSGLAATGCHFAEQERFAALVAVAGHAVLLAALIRNHADAGREQAAERAAVLTRETVGESWKGLLEGSADRTVLLSPGGVTLISGLEGDPATAKAFPPHRSFLVDVHPDDLPALQTRLREALTTGKMSDEPIRFRYKFPDGQYHPLETPVKKVDTGEFRGAVLHLRDRSEAEALADEHRIARTERDTARGERDSLHALTDRMQADQSAILGERDRLRAESQSRLARIDTLTAQVGELDSELVELRRNHEDLTARLHERTAERDRTGNLLVSLREQLGSAEGRVELGSRESADLRADLDGHRQQVSGLHSLRVDLERETAGLAKRKEQLESQLEQLERDTAREATLLTMEKDRLAGELESTRGNLDRTYQSLEQARQTAQAKLAEVEAETRAMETRLIAGESVRAVGHNIQGVASEFSNLLVGILGNVSLAQTQIAPSSPTQQILSETQAAALHARDLCQSLLPDAASTDVEATIAPEEILREAHLLVHLIAGRDNRLTFDLRPAKPIACDPVSLRQIAVAMIRHAAENLEASHPEGGTICLRVCRTTPEADRVRIEVEDTSTPMTPERAAGLPGTSLLSLVKLLERHSGRLELAQTAGGNVIRVDLPVSQAEAAAPPVVLVVDPDRAVLTIASRVLIGSGCTPLVAQSVAEAVNQFKGNAKAVTKVLLDLNLPAPGSAALYDRLKELRPDLTIVLTSHQPEGKAREAIAQANESGFLRKPWRPEELIRRVR